MVFEQHCAFCSEPPNTRGCLIFGVTAEGGEIWYHRLCATDAEAGGA